jgi:DNA-binding NarL/FixJ family response regulator
MASLCESEACARVLSIGGVGDRVEESARTNGTIRIVIADDQQGARHGLKALLATCDGIEVVGEAGSGSEAVNLVEGCRPDIVLMDARMPEMDGVEATRRIRERWPETPVLILTMYPYLGREAQLAGADRYLLKGCTADQLISAIHEIVLGSP